MRKRHRIWPLLAKLVVYGVLIAGISGCFPHKPGRRLAHFDSLAPPVGAPAPRFELQDTDGNPIRLAELIGGKPIVLQLGSQSCPVYRYRRFGMASLYKEYKNKANFLVVYTLEAHPAGAKSPYADGEWLTWWNRVANVRIPLPANAAERQKQARLSHETLQIAYPMVTDRMDNSIWQAYGAASSPAFVIDRNGHIALKQVWLNPKGIEQVLDRLLTDRSAPTSGKPASAARRSSLP